MTITAPGAAISGRAAGNHLHLLSFTGEYAYLCQ